MTSDCGHGEAALSNDSDSTGSLEESILVESSGAVHLGGLGRVGNYLLLL